MNYDQNSCYKGSDWLKLGSMVVALLVARNQDEVVVYSIRRGKQLMGRITLMHLRIIILELNQHTVRVLVVL